MEYYPRIIEKEMEKWLKRREAILVKGPRQSGKTTLFLHLKNKLGGSYVTLEDEDLLRTFEETPKLFAKRFAEKRKLFIDEAQYSKKAGKNIKLLYDLFPNLKVFITGSGSFDVKVEIGKYLVGRAVYFELLPLNFEEFLMWKAKDLHKIFCENKQNVVSFLNGQKVSIEVGFEKEFKALLDEYVTFGGFPAIVKEKDQEIKKELLKNLYRTYLEKDVFFFFNVRHLEKYRKLMRYISFSIGNLIEPSTVANDLKIDYKTFENYLNILINTYVVELISPFHKNLVTELKKSRKVYVYDIGLRNAVINNFNFPDQRTDRGKILENFILNEIKSFGEIRHWRTTAKAEVDFILLRKNEIVPIEVKSFGKPGRGFLSFLNTYKPKKAIVFAEKDFGIKKFGKTRVLFIPHWFV
ncbi:MAG: ATP-binding protein [Candidatus Diapherotrites archaeon]|nr:ATP-binding protein [Candidatus Diapherotrites archaeon]